MQELSLFMANHPLLVFITAALFVLLVIIEIMRARRATTLLTPTQTTHLINHDHAVIVDIRANDVYRKGHIIDALSLSMQDIKTNGKKLEKYKNKPIIFVCNTGVDSQKLSTQLKTQGYNTYALAGGLRAWTDAQMPLVKE